MSLEWVFDESIDTIAGRVCTGKLGGVHLALVTDDDGSGLEMGVETVETMLGFPDPSRCQCGRQPPHRRSDATVVDWSLRGGGSTGGGAGSGSAATSPGSTAAASTASGGAMTIMDATCGGSPVVVEGYFGVGGPLKTQAAE